ncbi:hypothetical protein D0Z07_6847 [Hyphodiscus hymeniophilus]|uniref:Uncharacterized protein n=1 Tax=Hyphodiscus hymeniophilus TaxID=353542 RepID=A0A9P7AVE8_9HELO|nr:hypothetical protein D0Z07_6847 [Hyphodiscus hymeniophilus]
MIHWIRYHAVDRNMQFKAMIEPFFQQFPERRAHATHQILTSRYYRDNDRPELDEHGNWGFYAEGKEKGKLRMVKSKVRDRQTEEGQEIDFPYTLVDKWPRRVLEYQWLSPILEEDRERAKRILAGDDPSDPMGSPRKRASNRCEL